MGSLRDLQMRSVQDLRRLADHLQVRVDGCLEKGELVDRIVNSGRVEIISDVEAQNTASCSLSREHLMSLSVREIKVEMQRYGVDCRGCIEKEEMVERLLANSQ